MSEQSIPRVWRRPTLPVSYRSQLRKTFGPIALICGLFYVLLIVAETFGMPIRIGSGVFLVLSVVLTTISALIFVPSVMLWIAGVLIEEIRRNAFENFLARNGVDPESYAASSSDGS